MMVALVAGLSLGVGSALHCAGMCGPLAALACRRGGAARSWMAYLGGRLLGYSVLGAALGALAGSAAVAVRSPWVGALASWSLALSLGLSAYWLWHGGTGQSSLVVLRTPRTRSLLHRWVERLARWPAALVGAGQTLLPCGALAAASLIAAGQANALAGAAAMAGFAVASSVGLLLPGLTSRWVSGFRRPLAVRSVAVALAVGAVWMGVRPVAALRDRGAEHPATCPMHSASQQAQRP